MKNGKCGGASGGSACRSCTTAASISCSPTRPPGILMTAMIFPTGALRHSAGLWIAGIPAILSTGTYTKHTAEIFTVTTGTGKRRSSTPMNTVFLTMIIMRCADRRTDPAAYPGVIRRASAPTGICVDFNHKYPGFLVTCVIACGEQMLYTKA